MFSGKQVPAVGISLGIERIFSLLEQKYRSQAEASSGKIRESKTQVPPLSARTFIREKPFQCTTVEIRTER
jgi:histidyl-tRNA synthetase